MTEQDVLQKIRLQSIQMINAAMQAATGAQKLPSGGRTAYHVSLGDPELPGVRAKDGRVNFTAELPEGAEAELVLYRRGEPLPCQVIPLPEEIRFGLSASVCLTVPDGQELEYTYRINGKEQMDPYAVGFHLVLEEKKNKTEGTCAEKMRGVWTEKPLCRTLPLHLSFSDAVCYKAHVKGLTAEKPSGVRHPGTFLGLQEYIPYLKKLGINTLLLMPIYEFSEYASETAHIYYLDEGVPVKAPSAGGRKKNYWGYSTGLYFAPKQSYCATDCPQQEVADLVDALHLAGIQVIPEFYFPPETGGRLVTDVLRHWALTYRVDGFHLVGEGGWITSVTADPLLKKTKLLYQNFSLPEEKIPVKRVRSCRLGVYNADFERTMRRFLKGDIDCSPEDVALCLRRNGVRQSYVNFMADQDGFTLADLVSYEEKHNEANGEGGRDGTDQNFSWNCGEEGDSRKHTVRSLRRQQLRNAVLLLMTSQGAPLLYAGDEVLNSQEGNNNAWCQDNSLGWVNWKRTRDARSMLSFVRACIQFRKDHPVLHQSLPLRMEDYKKTGYPDLSYHGHSAWVHQSGQTKAGIGVLYCGEYAEKAPGVPDDMIYIAYNMHWRPQEFAVPDLKKPMRWYRKADTSREDCFIPDENLQPEELLSGKVMEVPARTIVILIGKA